ncbi:hypothetical protein GF376_04135 [Candidatus Peregrinibacteria bacterium]|nr:hypothetical protein [Candidatus Peregrinibacteria bacterium]
MEKNPHENKLIVFEGIDLVGKTTMCEMSEEWINSIALERGLRGEEKFRAIGHDEMTSIQSKLFFEIDSDFIDKRKLRDLLMGKRRKSAVRLEQVPFDYPDRYKKVKEIECPDKALVVYLRRLAYKNKILNVLLPHFNMICDRYVHSILARARAQGANFANMNLDQIEAIAPDLTVLLTLDERQRTERLNLRDRDSITPYDKLRKSPGSFMETMEENLKTFSPEIVDCTSKTREQIFMTFLRPKLNTTLNVAETL